MSLGVLAVVGLALFTVHELDEIVLVRTYLRAAQDVPELRRSMWWRGRALHPSTPTLALIIGEEVVLIAAALVAGIAGNWPGLVVAVVVANSVHLVGHVVDAARTRRWTPGSPTALLTLPLFCFRPCISANCM